LPVGTASGSKEASSCSALTIAMDPCSQVGLGFVSKDPFDLIKGYLDYYNFVELPLFDRIIEILG
jgi:hypothetical protein